MRTDRNEGPHIHPIQVTTGSSSKDDMDIETTTDKHTTTMKKRDNENEAKGKEFLLASDIVLNMTCKHGDGKRRKRLTKVAPLVSTSCILLSLLMHCT